MVERSFNRNFLIAHFYVLRMIEFANKSANNASKLFVVDYKMVSDENSELIEMTVKEFVPAVHDYDVIENMGNLPIEIPEFTFECGICEKRRKKFASLKNLEIHIAKYHEEIVCFYCQNADGKSECFKNWMQWRDHLALEHKSQAAFHGIFYCEICCKARSLRREKTHRSSHIPNEE